MSNTVTHKARQWTFVGHNAEPVHVLYSSVVKTIPLKIMFVLW